MTGDGPLILPVVGSPDLNGLVCSRAGQPLPVRTELDRGHCLGVANQSELETVVWPLEGERQGGGQDEGMVEGVVKSMCALFSSASLLLALQTPHSSQCSNGTMEIHMYRPQEAGHRRQVT